MSFQSRVYLVAREEGRFDRESCRSSSHLVVENVFRIFDPCRTDSIRFTDLLIAFSMSMKGSGAVSMNKYYHLSLSLAYQLLDKTMYNCAKGVRFTNLNYTEYIGMLDDHNTTRMTDWNFIFKIIEYPHL